MDLFEMPTVAGRQMAPHLRDISCPDKGSCLLQLDRNQRIRALDQAGVENSSNAATAFAEYIRDGPPPGKRR